MSSTLAVFNPQRCANSIPRYSICTMGDVSVVEENLAMRCRSPSTKVAFGRAPPTEVPCSKARSSSGERGSPASTRAAESRSSPIVAVG